MLQFVIAISSRKGGYSSITTADTNIATDARSIKMSK